jgi:curved DNA-binding protein
MRDFYGVLGVPENAGADEIKKAYRRLAKQFHPDATGGDAKKADRFKEITEAYNVLGDEARRAEYDRARRGPFGGFAAGAAPGEGGFGGGRNPFEVFSEWFGRRAESTRPGGGGETGGEAGFGFRDVFNEFFSSAGRVGAQRPSTGRGRARSTQRPPDVRLPIELGFEEAALGATKPLAFKVEGERREIKVRIPPGAVDGTRLRLHGQGAVRGERRGDLVVEVKVTPHPHLRRQGRDVLLELPVTVAEAMLGARVEVPTVDGPVSVQVPAGTSSGTRLRLRGKGARSADGARGDQFVEVKIVVPSQLDRRARELAEQLRKVLPEDPRGF